MCYYKFISIDQACQTRLLLWAKSNIVYEVAGHISKNNSSKNKICRLLVFFIISEKKICTLKVQPCLKITKPTKF